MPINDLHDASASDADADGAPARTGEDVAPKRRKKPPVTWPWLLAGMIVVILISLVAGLMQTANATSSMAYDIGNALGRSIIQGPLLGLAVFGVIWLIALRRASKGRAHAHLAILIATAIGCGLLMAPVASIRAADMNSWAEMGPVVEAGLVEADALTADVDKEIARVDIEALFQPRALKAPGGYGKVRAEIARRRGLVQRSVTEGAAIAARIRTRMGATIRDPGRRDDALKGFDAGVAERQARTVPFLELQEKMFVNAEAQIALLERVSWQPEGGMFAFTRQSDLDAFNRLAAENSRMMQEAERIRANLKVEQDLNREGIRKELDAVSPQP
jgi:hypothetical protein